MSSHFKWNHSSLPLVYLTKRCQHCSQSLFFLWCLYLKESAFGNSHGKSVNILSFWIDFIPKRLPLFESAANEANEWVQICEEAVATFDPGLLLGGRVAAPVIACGPKGSRSWWPRKSSTKTFNCKHLTSVSGWLAPVQWILIIIIISKYFLKFVKYTKSFSQMKWLVVDEELCATLTQYTIYGLTCLLNAALPLLI